MAYIHVHTTTHDVRSGKWVRNGHVDGCLQVSQVLQGVAGAAAASLPQAQAQAQTQTVLTDTRTHSAHTPHQVPCS